MFRYLQNSHTEEEESGMGWPPLVDYLNSKQYSYSTAFLIPIEIRNAVVDFIAVL